MGARAGKPRHHGVALGDQLYDLQLKIAERGTKRRNPRPGSGGRAGLIQIVHYLEPALVVNLGHQAVPQRLTILGTHPGPPSENMITTTPRKPASVPAKSYWPACATLSTLPWHRSESERERSKGKSWRAGPTAD